MRLQMVAGVKVESRLPPVGWRTCPSGVSRVQVSSGPSRGSSGGGGRLQRPQGPEQGGRVLWFWPPLVRGCGSLGAPRGRSRV